ncbi:hypothetical protein NDU88_010280 [Pleurodeles waltl]|uniref:Uncharacterized protein n=1 Tax=Pleurodeles waltl TaxID=8319 RepID=A0AAV7QV84_PLEWA|nr:hypothetical protein NDU88_010280 [Pleurodeles waltl]
MHNEQGEKEGHVLAAQWRQQEASLAIPAIRAPYSTILAHPQEIAGAFERFYQTLYNPETAENHDCLTTFFTEARIPSLTEEGRGLLEGEINKEEIKQNHKF